MVKELKELELQENGVLTWLHLSDIHMNKSEVEQKPVLRKLTEDVKYCREEFDLNPDLVFLTGDISQKGLKSQYDAAKVILDNVGKASGIESNRMFLVPGNHDVNRKKTKSLSMSLLQEHLLERGSTDNEEIIKLFLFDQEHRKDREALLSKHDAYIKFITSNYPHCSPFEPPYYSVAGFNLPSGPNPERLWIVCLNTAWLGREGESENRLILGRHQIIHALDSVEDKGDSDNDIIVTLTHHPLSWLINWDEDFCKQIIEHQCDFHLCGHLHSPMLNFGGMVGPQRCSVIQAGAAYGSDQWYNGYNFVRLDFKSQKGRIYLRRFEPTLGGKWTADVRFTKPEYGQFEWEFGNRFLRKPSRPAKAISKLTPPVKKPAPSLDSLLMEESTWEGLMHRIDLARNSSPESKKSLITALLDVTLDPKQDVFYRQRAIFCLEEMKVTEHDAFFLALLRDSEQGVRASAALAIGDLKISDGFEQLIRLLKDPMENISVRRSAAIALGSFGNNKACEDLLTVIESADTNTERFGYDILASITVLDRKAVFFSRVIRLLKHDNFNIRSAAAQYFRKHLVHRAIPELIIALGDEEESPANVAAEALQQYVDLLSPEQEGKIIQFVDGYLQEYKDKGQTHDNPMWRGYRFYGLKRLLAEKAGKTSNIVHAKRENEKI